MVSLLPCSTVVSITSKLVLQGFTALPLSPGIDWSLVPQNSATIIEGRGQYVYWNGTYVTEITTDETGNPEYRRLVDEKDHPILQGEGMIPIGVSLYVAVTRAYRGLRAI